MIQPTLLIVDDEPAILASMSKVLEGDYRVRAANSGARALQVVSTSPHPDLILLDVSMPDLDGYAVLERLKADPSTENIPVIFVTAAEAVEDEERALIMGAADYISKPIIPAIMLARIKIHLSLKDAQEFLRNKNDILEAEVARRIKENRIIENVSLRVLAHLAETRDPETGDHILRTQSFVEILARGLKDHPRFKDTIDDHFIALLTKSAPLHDIGKVGIPDHVLHKPGKLDSQEWAIMKTHSELGARAIEQAEADVEQPAEFLALAKEMAHWHHERWDGKGYPDGLMGEEIPISARIMALADVFDAIINERVYKPIMSFNKARKIIEDARDRQFDPDITDVFLQSFDQFVAIAQQHQQATGT